MEQDIEKSIIEFKKYVNKFDLSNDMISRKYYHTFRVVNYAKELAKSENLNEHDNYIAFLCALLHDIARFKQATEFNTFIDLISFDHGDVGYDILIENDYISNYIKNEVDRNIVLKAVKNHNKFSVENSLNDRELFFTKLVRDADKLDIMDKQVNEINDNELCIDDSAIDALRHRKLFKRTSVKKNDVTKLVSFICFIFDLNFKRSFEIILEKKIVERKLAVLRQCCNSELVNEIESIVFEFIEDKMN